MRCIAETLLSGSLALLLSCVTGSPSRGERGVIAAWGYNDAGQCNVPAPNASFIAVSAGWLRGEALKADGTVIAWGDNCCGQQNLPNPNTGFIALAAGGYHGLGFRNDPASAEDAQANASRRLTAFPVPSSEDVSILHVLLSPSPVITEFFDARGCLVRRISQDAVQAGGHLVQWNGRDWADRPVPAGIHFARIATAEGVSSGRVVITRSSRSRMRPGASSCRESTIRHWRIGRNDGSWSARHAPRKEPRI
jgi:hypothetical protein